MTTIGVRRQSRAATWGWGILLVISALLVLNGVGLFISSARSYTSEEEAILAILLAGIGLISVMVAWEGFRRRTRWAWNTLWVVFGTLAAVGLQSVLLAGQVNFIGGMYIGLAAVTLVGLLLARRELEP